MNYVINSILKWIKVNPIIVIGIVIILAIFIWYFQTKLWNGVGNLVFAAKMTWQEKNLQKELDSAAAQQKEIDQTLLELAKSKEALAAAKREREIAEKIFDDKSKTAKEKVAAYEAALQGAPVHTDSSGVTVNDLCARAKAIGASAATVASLCGN